MGVATEAEWEEGPETGGGSSPGGAGMAWGERGTEARDVHADASAAADVITTKVWNEDDHTWTPDKFIENNPGGQAGLSNQDVNIEHFCAPVIHPVTGETITQ